jgi:hypothetical protein
MIKLALLFLLGIGCSEYGLDKGGRHASPDDTGATGTDTDPSDTNDTFDTDDTDSDDTASVDDDPFDDARVALVVATQCHIADGGDLDAEVTSVLALLDELGVVETGLYSEALGDVTETTDLSGWDAVLFTKCGWHWGRNGAVAANATSIRRLSHAASAGVNLFFFGDDMAFQMANLAEDDPATLTMAQDLVLLEASDNNGTQPTDVRIVSGDFHPVATGYEGTPTDFTYAYDIDYSDVAGDGIVLADHNGWHPVWVVAEKSGYRTATLVTSVQEANHGATGDEHARDQLRIMFVNSLAWLLE